MPRPPDLLDTTEQIAALLAEQGIHAMGIGVAAMPAHGYVRQMIPEIFCNVCIHGV